MILTCDKCSTKYFIEDEFIQPLGKNVKCIKCGYIWFQDVPNNQPTIKTEPIPEGSSLPVIIETEESIWLKIMPIFFLVLIVITSLGIFQDRIKQKLPFTGKIYSYLGKSVSTNIQLESIEIVRGDDYLNINGYLLNTSPEQKKKPNITIIISDLNGDKLLGSSIAGSDEIIASEERSAIHKRIFNLPNNAHFVVLRVE